MEFRFLRQLIADAFVMYLSNKWKIGVIEQVHVWHVSPAVGSWHECVCMCVYVYVCECVCMCMCVCACVCVNVLSAHGHI